MSVNIGNGLPCSSGAAHRRSYVDNNVLKFTDVDLVIRRCEGLPKMDLVGHADPYVLLRVAPPDGAQALHYRTAVIYNTARPIWDEELWLQNVPLGTSYSFQIWDKDHLSADDSVGTCQFTLTAEMVAAALTATEASDGGGAGSGGGSSSSSSGGGAGSGPGGPGAWAPAAAPVATVLNRASAPCGTLSFPLPAAGSDASRPPSAMLGRACGFRSAVEWRSRWEEGPRGCGATTLRLPIQAARGVHSPAGWLEVELRCRPTSSPGGPMVHCGPVRYRISVSSLAGALTRHTQDDGWSVYAAYKLTLAGVPQFFPQGATQHWNTAASKARMVFLNPPAIAAVRAQHSMLYADNRWQRRRGVLRGGGDLVALLRGGVRDRQRRYFTYCLVEGGSWCFSETGAAFFSDFMSKHAMHACCAERVIFAGEFCLVPPSPLPPPRLPAQAAASAPAAPGPLPPLITTSGGGATPSPASMAPSTSTSSGEPLPPLSRPRRGGSIGSLLSSLSNLGGLSSSSPSPSPSSSPHPSSHPQPHPPTTSRSGRIGSTSAPVTRQPSGGLAITAAEAADDAKAALAALAGVGGCEARGWRLVVDNNSGTYVPPREKLGAVAALLEHNFPGLRVEVVAVGDPQLEAYHARVPSRVRQRAGRAREEETR